MTVGAREEKGKRENITIFSAAVLSNQITDESNNNLLDVLVFGCRQNLNKNWDTFLFTEEGSNTYYRNEGKKRGKISERRARDRRNEEKGERGQEREV